MTASKRIARQVPLMILWLALSALVWSFVFNLITDTDPAHKLVIYAEAQVPDPTALDVRLEEGKGRDIRMVRVHPFSYALMDAGEISHADLYILTESGLSTYADWLAPVPEALREGRALHTADGEAYGILLRPASSADPGGWIRTDGAESLWLAFGRNSRHLPGLDGAADGEAVSCAERLMALLTGPVNE